MNLKHPRARDSVANPSGIHGTLPEAPRPDHERGLCGSLASVSRSSPNPPSQFFSRRERSAFRYQTSPVRRSEFLQSAVSPEAFESGLAALPVSGMERYAGRLVEYMLPTRLGRLVISAGDIGGGLLGVAVDYWGDCEREWDQLARWVRQVALPRTAFAGDPL